MEKYVPFKDLIKNTQAENNFEKEFIFEKNIPLDNLQELYQIVGINDNNKAYIMHIGYGEKRPKILLKEFKFKNYNCKIISYILNKFDLEESTKTNSLKMVSLIMYKDDKSIIELTDQKENLQPILSISIRYDIINSNNKSLLDLVSRNNINIETYGTFSVYLKKYKSEENIKLYSFEKYFGNNNLIEKLVKFLTHKELIYLY